MLTDLRGTLRKLTKFAFYVLACLILWLLAAPRSDDPVSFFSVMSDVVVPYSIGAIVAGVPLVWIYCIPALLAQARLHSQAVPILFLTLLLGSTFVFWALALVWALMEDNRPAAPVAAATAPPPTSLTPGDVAGSVAFKMGSALGSVLGGDRKQ